jgi:uncharacterized cupredoxin-like copper-binding protein
MRKFPVMVAASAVALLLAGCGDSDEGSEVQPAASAARDAGPTTTAASSGATTTAASSGATTTAASGSATTAAAASVPVTLADRTVQANTTFKGGAVTFAIKNNSPQNQHELVVVKGKFADLPKTGIGAVDEPKLAAGALVGRSDRLAGGASANVTMNLPAGPYVLLCNLVSGPTSHAALGQVLDVTVS